MSDIRERLSAHRLDTLTLLRQVTATSEIYSGLRLAGAVGHLAWAQVLIAEELEGLSGVSNREGAASESRPAEDREDDTPVEGIRRGPAGPTKDRD
jgi:hypothetical protein